MTTLATPYYGSTIRPHGRPENIYVKLVANKETGEIVQTEICVWNPKQQPNLPNWLSQQGVEILLCNHPPTESDSSFSAAGIIKYRTPHGDFQDMINCWSTKQTQGCEVLAA